MKPLHEMYAEVVAKRPELAVTGLIHDKVCWHHRQLGNGPCNEAAAALILAHWIGKLPLGCALRNFLPGVWICGNIASEFGRHNGDTPLAALHAFYTRETA